MTCWEDLVSPEVKREIIAKYGGQTLRDKQMRKIHPRLSKWSKLGGTYIRKGRAESVAERDRAICDFVDENLKTGASMREIARKASKIFNLCDRTIWRACKK